MKNENFQSAIEQAGYKFNSEKFEDGLAAAFCRVTHDRIQIETETPEEKQGQVTAYFKNRSAFATTDTDPNGNIDVTFLFSFTRGENNQDVQLHSMTAVDYPAYFHQEFDNTTISIPTADLVFNTLLQRKNIITAPYQSESEILLPLPQRELHRCIDQLTSKGYLEDPTVFTVELLKKIAELKNDHIFPKDQNHIDVIPMTVCDNENNIHFSILYEFDKTANTLKPSTINVKLNEIREAWPASERYLPLKKFTQWHIKEKAAEAKKHRSLISRATEILRYKSVQIKSQVQRRKK